MKITVINAMSRLLGKLGCIIALAAIKIIRRLVFALIVMQS